VTPAPTLAAVLSTGDHERLYSGLSVLVSTAVDGGHCSALASFRALELLLDRTPSGRGDRFDHSLGELIDTATELDTLDLYACAATVDLLGIEGEPFDGVMSTPRFLRETAGARPVVV
jgi:hypothetical protein